MISAYRDPDRAAGRKAMQGVIDAVSRGVPAALVELRRLGRTLKKRAAGLLKVGGFNRSTQRVL